MQPDAGSSSPRLLTALSIAVVALLVASGLRPHDRATWFMEVLPAMLALPILWFTWRRFPLTTLVYVCIALHAAVLIVGGTYTYARVPAGYWFADLLHLSRNPYDRLGHLFQGFVPALVAREILIRGVFVNGRRMLAFVVVCIVLAISAGYELVEWGAAIAMGQAADQFLGTQGDVWDTQSDMLCALIGAVAALATCGRWHDRQIAALDPGAARP